MVKIERGRKKEEKEKEKPEKGESDRHKLSGRRMGNLDWRRGGSKIGRGSKEVSTWEIS